MTVRRIVRRREEEGIDALVSLVSLVAIVSLEALVALDTIEGTTIATR